MPEAGFFAQKRGSPTGLSVVVLAHAAVLGALILIKGPEITGPERVTTTVTSIPVPDDPPPKQPPEPRDDPATRPLERMTSTPTVIERPIIGPVMPPLPPLPPPFDPPGNTITRDPPADPPAPPVRRGAAYDQRYADALQPPYPRAEESAQRTGQVRVRVTIAPNGRVTRVARLSATSDAFWRATERQALSHWRFRPATVDGRPVESTMVFTVNFRIADV